MSLVDACSRPLRNLRVSVTDRCNLRCDYCMPEGEYAWLPRERLLSFEEISALVDVFLDLGVDKLRLTGGEPLLRRGVSELIADLAGKSGLRDLAMTTNGILLAEQAASLAEAGLHRLTVSLDTLRADRFRALTQRDDLSRVLAGIDAARSAGFDPIKVDTVVMRGVNDDELVELLEFARGIGAELRFIEYMDVGGATRWTMRDVVSRAEILERLSARHGEVEPLSEETSAPADRYRLPDGQVFGVISSTTAPFCSACDRSRVTADGQWFRCLYATSGTDLATPLRAGVDEATLAGLIAGAWRSRADRGAEDRLAEHDRRALLPPEELRDQPHMEMHRRGG